MAVPSPPFNLIATVTDFGSADLVWELPGSGVNGVKVERRPFGSFTAPDQTGWGVIATLGIVTSYTDNLIWGGQTFDYRIVAFNTDGDSVPSNEVSVQPEVPPLITLSSTSLPATAPRNTLSPMEASFLSPKVYGLERNPDGSATGFKY